MQVYFMAPWSCAYRAFATTFEALEAPYFCRETVLEYPRCRHTNNKSVFVTEDFVAKENFDFAKTCQLMRELMLATK
jgi:hypothetical protein